MTALEIDRPEFNVSNQRWVFEDSGDMRRHSRSLLLRYFVLVIAVLSAFALTLLIPFVRQRETFIFFFGAVSFSAWFGGRGPGLLACFMGAFLQNFFITEPQFEFSYHAEALIPVLLFLIVSFMICSFTVQLVRAEDAAQEQRQLLEITLSSIGDAVIATDAGGRVTFMNAVAEKLTGWTVSMARGKNNDQVFRVVASGASVSENRPMSLLPEYFLRVLREKLTINFPSNIVLMARNPAAMPIEGNLAPIKNKQGTVVGTVLVFRDVTERENIRKKVSDYQERLRSLALEVSLAAERERRGIATGLHDRVGQALALTRIKLGDLRGELTDSALIGKVDEMTRLLKSMIAEIRSLTFELSPPILYEFGLEAALEWLTTTVHKQHNLSCEFSSDGNRIPLKQEFSVLLFQTVRELLTNVVKHSRAKHVTVGIERSATQVTVKVEDDGDGFDTSSALRSPETSGFGLFSIRERISYLGGSFSIDSHEGRGSSAVLVLPV